MLHCSQAVERSLSFFSGLRDVVLLPSPCDQQGFVDPGLRMEVVPVAVAVVCM